MLNVTTSC